jgi:hypothetical protein
MNPSDELLNAFGQANNAAGFRAGQQEGVVLGILGVGVVLCLFFGGAWLYHDNRTRVLEARARQLQPEQKPIPTPSYLTRTTLV